MLGRPPINRKDRCRKFSWGGRVRLFRRRVRCRASVDLDSTGSARPRLGLLQSTILLNQLKKVGGARPTACQAIGSSIAERVLCARNTGRLEEP